MDQNQNNLQTYLCPEDPDEAGRRYLRLHQKLTGFFQLRGVADPTVAANEALDQAAKMIAQDTDVPEINVLCLRIARSMLKEGSRHNTDESTAFLKFLEQQEYATDTRMNRFSLMKTCFEKLSKDDQDLLDWYCVSPSGPARIGYRVELAGRLNTTVKALNIEVTRVRRGLDECVRELGLKSQSSNVN